MTGKSIVKRSIKVRTGIEGPRHDPYGYTEVTVTQQYEGDSKSTVVTHHAGLGEWIHVNNNPALHDEDADGWFQQITGMTPEEAVDAYRHLHRYKELHMTDQEREWLEQAHVNKYDMLIHVGDYDANRWDHVRQHGCRYCRNRGQAKADKCCDEYHVYIQAYDQGMTPEQGNTLLDQRTEAYLAVRAAREEKQDQATKTRWTERNRNTLYDYATHGPVSGMDAGVKAFYARLTPKGRSLYDDLMRRLKHKPMGRGANQNTTYWKWRIRLEAPNFQQRYEDLQLARDYLMDQGYDAKLVETEGGEERKVKAGETPDYAGGTHIRVPTKDIKLVITE